MINENEQIIWSTIFSSIFNLKNWRMNFKIAESFDSLLITIQRNYI